MSDFRLKVFYTVAKRLNFTKAASELFITQPAVTNHIHELEEEYKVNLFNRSGNKISLTAAGEVLLKHAEKIFSVYRDLDFELNAITHRGTGTLRLGASTTVSQYIIPPMLADFRKKFRDVAITLQNDNTEQIENRLLRKEIDLGVIEGRSKKPEIKYIEFLKDEIVLVARNAHPYVKRDELRLSDLTKIPIVLREPGSGTLEVIEHALKPHKIKLAHLQVEMHLGSTEGIKSYLMHSECVAFLSIHSVTNELQRGDLRVIDIRDVSINRSFYFIHLQGKADGLAETFMRFSKSSQANH